MADDAAWDEFRAKLEQIENHPGRIAHYRWGALQRVHRVLAANEAELLSLVDEFANNPTFAIEIMRSPGDPGVRDAFYDELFRRMHNYLSAVKMLVDHTRNLSRAYEGTDFANEYQKRVAEFAETGCGPFLQKLRDYLVHYKIPPFGLDMHWEQGDDEATFTVHLARDAALEFKEWPSRARDYLRSQPEKIPLAPLVREYSGDIERLYRWLYDQFFELHQGDIAEYNELIVEFQGAENTPGHPAYRDPRNNFRPQEESAQKAPISEAGTSD